VLHVDPIYYPVMKKGPLVDEHHMQKARSEAGGSDRVRVQAGPSSC
jgi:hypothetical protein